MNIVRIKRGISNIQECNPILLVPPNAIINPKKAWYNGIYNKAVYGGQSTWCGWPPPPATSFIKNEAKEINSPGI